MQTPLLLNGAFTQLSPILQLKSELQASAPEEWEITRNIPRNNILIFTPLLF